MSMFLRKSPDDSKDESKKESKPVVKVEPVPIVPAKPVESKPKKKTTKQVIPQKPIEKPIEPPKAQTINIDDKLVAFGKVLELLDKKIAKIQSDFSNQLTASNSNIDVLRAELNKKQGVAIVQDSSIPVDELRSVVSTWLNIRKRAKTSHGTENLVWIKLNAWYIATEPKKQ